MNFSQAEHTFTNVQYANTHVVHCTRQIRYSQRRGSKFKIIPDTNMLPKWWLYKGQDIIFVHFTTGNLDGFTELKVFTPIIKLQLLDMKRKTHKNTEQRTCASSFSSCKWESGIVCFMDQCEHSVID